MDRRTASTSRRGSQGCWPVNAPCGFVDERYRILSGVFFSLTRKVIGGYSKPQRLDIGERLDALPRRRVPENSCLAGMVAHQTRKAVTRLNLESTIVVFWSTAPDWVIIVSDLASESETDTSRAPTLVEEIRRSLESVGLECQVRDRKRATQSSESTI